MKLKKKWIGLRKYIVDESNNLVFRVKDEGFLTDNEVLCGIDDEIKFSLKAEKESDRYIFNNHTTGKKVYAYIKERLYITADTLTLSCPKEFYIKEDECGNKISVKRSDRCQYDIYVNDKKDGIITDKLIESVSINDKELLSVLFVFSKHIIYDEELLMLTNIIRGSA